MLCRDLPFFDTQACIDSPLSHIKPMSLLISKSITQLLLPPGSIILMACIGLIFWKKSWGRTLVALSMVLLYALSIEPVRDILAQPLEQHYPVLTQQQVEVLKQHQEPTAIVLLGGGLYEKAPEYGGSDELHFSALMRTLYATELAKQSGLHVYASGGTPLTEGLTEPEGSVMVRWLIRLGVPETQVHAESSANNTWENAAYIQGMLAKQGIHRIILVTSAWHMPRSVWCFENHQLQVIAAPCDYMTEVERYDLRSWLPRWNVLSDSGQALHEYLGSFFYWLKYA